MRTSQDYETGNWHGKWCAASLKSFVRINKYLKNENTVICQESFQSSLPAMCTQTQDVLKTFRVNIFLLFLLLFFRSAELWVHSSTAVGVSGYILSSARARPPEYPSPTRRGCTWPTPAWWCPGTCRPTRATQHFLLTRCHCQLTSLYIGKMRAKWETCGFSGRRVLLSPRWWWWRWWSLPSRRRSARSAFTSTPDLPRSTLCREISEK